MVALPDLVPRAIRDPDEDEQLDWFFETLNAFVGILFTGALLIEVIFSIEGIGLLSYEAIIKRDYPILFGTLFCFTLVGLLMQLIGDLIYTVVDPRIDFETRE